MEVQIFAYSDYKDFILKLEKTDPRYARGFRSRLFDGLGRFLGVGGFGH